MDQYTFPVDLIMRMLPTVNIPSIKDVLPDAQGLEAASPFYDATPSHVLDGLNDVAELTGRRCAQLTATNYFNYYLTTIYADIKILDQATSHCHTLINQLLSHISHIYLPSRYRLFDYIGHPAADRVVVIMGSAGLAVEEAVRHLERQGQRVGLVKVCLKVWEESAGCDSLLLDVQPTV